MSEKSPGFKFAEHEVNGIPVRIEIGSRDLENGVVTRYNFEINGTTVTNETPLECFNLEQTETGYKITEYSDSCTKDVIIPKYNSNAEEAYLDIYEVIDITFDMNACKEYYMEKGI